jgi:membrane protein implicated in regulation of membrane protease activity
MIEFVFWYWWIAGVLLLGVEMLSTGFFFLWMGISAFITGLLHFLIPALSPEVQLLIFAILSVVSVLLWKKYVNHKPHTTDQPYLNQRGAQYVGQTFTLIEAIEHGRGKIKVADSPWRVECEEDCPVGSAVKVIAVDGTIFKVMRVG